MTSIQVLATPMIGRDKSSSVKPTAFNMARAGARPGPTNRSWLLSFNSFGMMELLSFLAFLLLFVLLVFLRFHVYDRAGGRVDMDFRHFAVCSHHFHFPDRLVVFLFEFGLDRRARNFLQGRLNSLIDGHLGIFDERRDVVFPVLLLIAPGGSDGRQHGSDHEGENKAEEFHEAPP